MRNKTRGFSLVELIVTVAIAAILMGFGIPAYRQYVQRANRVDATSALMRLAANQERFYLQNNTYASDALLATAPPQGLGFDHTERQFYTVTLAPRGADYTTGYTATATVIAGGNQADDTDCRTFTVDDRGQHTAVNSGGADNTDTCWR